MQCLQGWEGWMFWVKLLKTSRKIEMGMHFCVSCSLWICWCGFFRHIFTSFPTLAFPFDGKSCFYVNTFEGSNCAVFGNLIIPLPEFSNPMLFSKHVAERLFVVWKGLCVATLTCTLGDLFKNNLKEGGIKLIRFLRFLLILFERWYLIFNLMVFKSSSKSNR